MAPALSTPHGLLLVGVAALLFVAVAPSAALAHPFGTPPTALLTASGSTVAVEWRSSPDDAAAIGVELGYLQPWTVAAYLDAPAQAAPSARDEAALAASPELRQYLLSRIVVRQDGVLCEGVVPPVEDFVHGGARVVHRCPAPVTAVEVEISMLHDLHEAYRTFGVAEDEATQPAQAVFSVTSPRHRFDFSHAGQPVAPATRGAGVPALPLVGLGIAGLLVAAAVAGLLVAGRRA